MSERTVSALIVGIIVLGLLWALRPVETRPLADSAQKPMIEAAMIPLVSGDESIDKMFTKAGCVVCHTIPGIPGAEGQVGPPLALGSTGRTRLQHPDYRGTAKTVHEYVIESVIEPERFVVPGYPNHTMPTWYGAKLSALALEKIASYLEVQTGEVPDRGRSGTSK